MFGFGPDVLYETWCRNADLIFQNASTTGLPPGMCGTQAPGDGSAGDTPSKRRRPTRGVGEEGTLSKGRRRELRKGRKRAGKYQLTGSARHRDCNYCSSGTVAFRPTVSACHARQGSKAHRYRAERAPHRPCGARERDGSGIRDDSSARGRQKKKGDKKIKRGSKTHRLRALPRRFCYRYKLLGGLGPPRRGRRHFDGSYKRRQGQAAPGTMSLKEKERARTGDGRVVARVCGCRVGSYGMGALESAALHGREGFGRNGLGSVAAGSCGSQDQVVCSTSGSCQGWLLGQKKGRCCGRIGLRDTR
ncbi:uncharacterized protein B0H64DRAFT_171671 [Chaetomium fimeti]|uniref:Uncharacterized protein n=1 Tax=Chaetomium fimeti TaxID=1854472 RepID=A0AAE0HJ16_9PEZI|nr:hypothetical protein B0H64DRAFT_171671 [Chaetomium fimeti]